MATQRELHDVDGKSRGWYAEANRVNDLTGREWVFWSRSVISKPYPPNLQHALRNRHGGQKPPELCADLVRVFSKQGQAVLDPFMGVGGVLLGASLAGRKATGIEINPAWIAVYREVCRLEGIAEQEAIAGDSRVVLPTLNDGRCFDLVLTDVPYWKMDRAPRSRGTWKRVGEPARPVRGSRLTDFAAGGGPCAAGGGPCAAGEYADKAAWLAAMVEVFTLAARLLKPHGYLVSFIGDMYRDNEYHGLSADLAGALARVPGLVWKANLVWYDVSKRLHLYGYRYAFIPSLIHQNILVFRREA